MIYYNWFIIALAIINGAALLLANFKAYCAKHIQTEFSESHFIGLSMGVMLQSFLLALPAFVTDTKNTMASYAIIAALISLVSGLVLYLIFIPKILAWWWNNSKQERTNHFSISFGIRMEQHNLMPLADCCPSDRHMGLLVKSQCSIVLEMQEERVENYPAAMDNVITAVDDSLPTEVLPQQMQDLGS